MFKSNNVDADIVIVVYSISSDSKICDVSVQHQRLARTCLQVVNFVSVYDQIGDWTCGIGAIHGDAESIGSVAGAFSSGIGLLDIVDIVIPNLDMGTVAVDANACGNPSGIGGTIVANLKMLDFYVAHVSQRDHGAIANLRSQTASIQHRRLSRLAAKCNVTLGRVPGGCDGQPLAIFSAANVDGISRLRYVRRMLHCQKWLFFCAWIGIASMRRHI